MGFGILSPIMGFYRGVLSPLFVLDHRHIRMECPRCKGETVKKGRYNTRRESILHRYYCRKCDYNFTERTKDFGKKISSWKVNEILIYHNMMKPKVNKYDPLKLFTYSTREIAKKVGVGNTFVAEVLKNRKNKNELK